MAADEHAHQAPIFGHVQGNGAATVVFVHGFGGSHAGWSQVAARLGDAARTIAYDLPGHGYSLGFPGAGSAKLAAQAILADLTQRGIETVHAVGHSMGGAIAALMALLEPKRIAALTLLAPGGFGLQINAPLLRRYAAAVSADEIRACLAAMYGKGATVPESAVEASLALRDHRGQTEKLAEIVEMITRGDRQGAIPRELLATLPMPVTVLWGTHDPVLPPAQAEGLPAGFRVQMVADAGHMLVEEAPRQVLQAILANLEPRAALPEAT